MSDPIHQAAIEHVWQEEQLAHAEWRYGMTEGQRQEMTADDTKNPWRAIMRTSVRRLIEALEAAGFYDNRSLHGAGAQARKPAVYQHSPYDYEVARRVEARVADDLWSRARNA